LGGDGAKRNLDPEQVGHFAQGQNGIDAFDDPLPAAADFALLQFSAAMSESLRVMMILW
jgi:hypothetical protein